MTLTRSMFLAAAVLVLVAACSESADETTSTSDIAATEPDHSEPPIQRQPEGATTFFSIEEVGIDPDGWVTLENVTSVEVTLDGLYLCQADDCFALPDVVVDPGSRAVIATGDAPATDSVVVTGATIGTLRPDDGEVALFVTNPGEASSLITYLEWGATPHRHTGDAISNGLWLEGTFAPSGENAIRLYRDSDTGLWLWDASG